MRSMSINELSRYSSTMLRWLAARMECTLAGLPDDAIERYVAIDNLQNIRRLLALRELSPH